MLSEKEGFNSLPNDKNDKILHHSKLKALADENYKLVTRISKHLLYKADNIVGEKKRNACYQLFLLFPHCLQRFDLFPNKRWFLRVSKTSLLKTLREKEKLLVMSNFSFSHSVFHAFDKLFAIFIKSEIVVCKLFQFGSA